MTNTDKLLKNLYARKSARFNRYADEWQALRDKLEADLKEIEKKFYEDMADIKGNIDLLTGVNK